MVVGIYSPYLETLGGGEQYLFTIAQCLLSAHTVIIFCKDPTIIKKAESRFGLDLSKLTVQSPVWESGTLIEKIRISMSLDVLFYCSDGSIPLSFAKKTFLLFQFPVNWVKVSPLIKFKLQRITNILCYSQFVKGYLDKTFQTNTQVIPPAIRFADYSLQSKEKIILSVGRFTKAMNTKKQEILIEAFKKFVAAGNADWKLILIGGMLEADQEYVTQLKEAAADSPIEILINVSRETLLTNYSRAMFYWHAAGFGEDVVVHPERAEHFGITTVEAMASGAVPFVFPAGGQQEVVDESYNGIYWHTQEELIKKTIECIKNPPEIERLRHAARIKADTYDIEKFCSTIRGLVI